MMNFRVAPNLPEFQPSIYGDFTCLNQTDYLILKFITALEQLFYQMEANKSQKIGPEYLL